MTEPDTGKALGRILAVLEADPTLSKLVQTFRLGERPDAEIDEEYPLVYVTTARTPYRSADQYGSGADMDGLSQAFFEIGVAVVEAKPDAAKLALLDIVDRIRRVINDNPTMLNPEGYEPVFLRSIITSVDEDAEHRGDLAQSAVLTLKAQVGAQWSIAFPGGLEIRLLSKPLEHAPVNYDKSRLADGELVFTEVDREV